jgi:hypothetical protein
MGRETSQAERAHQAVRFRQSAHLRSAIGRGGVLLNVLLRERPLPRVLIHLCSCGGRAEVTQLPPPGSSSNTTPDEQILSLDVAAAAPYHIPRTSVSVTLLLLLPLSPWLPLLRSEVSGPL